MKYNFKHKKIAVAGLARSGMAAALLLKNMGACVYATDSGDSDDLRKNARLLTKKGIKAEIGAHTREFIEGKDLIVISPGVPEDSIILKWAAEEKVIVIGEIELGFLCCEAPIIAVTGTNGKSTTTTLIGRILKKAGINTVVCGNIGNPFCGEIQKAKKNSIVVLEVSSFQLESIKKFRPHVAVVLNISQNHFDRHPDLRSYINAKARILENQKKSDWTVLNFDDPLVRRLKAKAKARVIYFSRKRKSERAFCEDGRIFILRDKEKQFVCEASELKIKGEHNIENALVSLSVASIFGVKTQAMRRALTTFKGLEHRFEHVAEIGGVEFINDSKGTTVLATVMALESCDRPVLLIAGGHDKGSDFGKARDAVASKAKKVILIGEAKDKIRRQLNGAAVDIDAGSMRDAVRKAFSNAKRGDCVLLSPMCASFDMFKNYEERGKAFKREVMMLAKGVK